MICGLLFGRTSKMKCEKYDEKCYDQWYISILLNTYNYQKHRTFEGIKNYEVNSLKNRRVF